MDQGKHMPVMIVEQLHVVYCLMLKYEEPEQPNQRDWVVGVYSTHELAEWAQEENKDLLAGDDSGKPYFLIIQHNLDDSEQEKPDRINQQILDDIAKKGRGKRVFDNCNVCGVRLRTKDEDRMGMCEKCAAE